MDREFDFEIHLSDLEDRDSYDYEIISDSITPEGEPTCDIKHGNLIVEVDGKKFYQSVTKGIDVIQIGDSVDVVVQFLSEERRITRLAKIAAIFQDETDELFAEVAYYYDANDKIPGITADFSTQRRSGNEAKDKWQGFTHHNEVIASNLINRSQFQCVTAEAIDDIVQVHSSLEEYQAAVEEQDDEYGHVFCNKMCYKESHAIKPFDIKTKWNDILLESSEYNRVYLLAKGDATELKAFQNDYILGRENEANQIRTFIETGIKQGGTGQLLYISGVPGTGKTATVNMVVKEILNKKHSGKLPWFELVEINGVNLVDPNDFYRVLYKKIFKKKSPHHINAYKQLDKFFENNKTPIVIIVDEADYIVTKKQKVLFTIFNWPQRKNSKLIVVIVSNTMDLPSKMKASCVSRLAFGTLVFQPYKYQQILAVLSANKDIANNIDDLALQLCARRVTNYSGDMRKAMQICKLALSLANDGKVTTADMNRVSNMVLSSAVIEALRHSSKPLACLLVAMVLELKDTQLNVACARKVYDAFRGMMAVLEPDIKATISINSFKKLLVSAATSGIISLEPTVFTSVAPGRKVQIDPVISEELGDTGIVPEVDVGQIVTALSRDPFWEQRLRDL